MGIASFALGMISPPLGFAAGVVRKALPYIMTPTGLACSALALSLAGNAWQHHQHKVDSDRIASAKAETAQCRADHAKAVQAAKDAQAKEEARIKDVAQYGQDQKTQLESQRDALLDAWRRANALLVRKDAPVAADPASTSQNPNPPVSGTTASPATVATTGVDDAGLKNWDDSYTYAKACYDWAQKLRNRGDQ